LRKPQLAALRAFEAAARLGGMRKAARELMIDHAVVSRHIRDLQAELQVELLKATSVEFTLTKQGAALSERLSLAFSDMDAAIAEARGVVAGHRLRISCIHGFAQKWLLHHLHEFTDAHPSIETELLSVDEAQRLAAVNYDVSILYGALSASNPRQKLLLRPRIHVVARPDLAKAFNGKQDDFASFIQSVTLLHDGDPQQWRRWLLVAIDQVPTSRRSLSFSNASICIEAALLGQGVALANEVLVQAELNAGKLVSLWPEAVFLDCYYLQLSEHSRHKQECRKFMNWITALTIPSGASSSPPR
jgi:LysR family transcriptional regulator, glycine cleavage system transcriptional activator